MYRKQYLSRFPWPIAIVMAMGLIVPTLCIIWMVNHAVDNERLSMQQRIQAIHRSQVELFAQEWGKVWSEYIKEVKKEVARFSQKKNEEDGIDGTHVSIASTDYGLAMYGQNLFGFAVNNTYAMSSVIYNSESLLYPNFSKEIEYTGITSNSLLWEDANTLEFANKDYISAIRKYKEIFKSSRSVSEQGRSLFAIARCKYRAGRIIDAIASYDVIVGDTRYNQSVTRNGYNLQLSAALRALELNFHIQNDISSRAPLLISRLASYETEFIPSDQRVFFATKLSEIQPDSSSLIDVINQEKIASIVASRDEERPQSLVDFPGVIERIKLSPRDDSDLLIDINLIFDREGINALLKASSLGKDNLLYSLSIAPVDAKKGSSEGSEVEASVVFPLEGIFSGWGLVMHLTGDNYAISVTESKVRTYYWVAFLIVILLISVTYVTGRYSYKQLHLNRLKNNFIATVSHELKTPLASTRLLLDTLLKSDEEFSPRTAEYLQLMTKENKRLSRLIDNLLTFSRMEHNSQVFHFEKVDIVIVTKRALEIMYDKLKSNEFEIVQSYDVDHCEISADDEMLITAIANLLENAYKYSTTVRYVHIHIYKTSTHVNIEISDKGIGLTPEHMKKIFDRFYRVDQRLSRETEGSGLGLNIVQFIVRAHKGKIDVKSIPNQGSSFTISLPLSPLD